MKLVCLAVLGGCSLFEKLPHRVPPPNAHIECSESYATPAVEAVIAIAGAIVLVTTSDSTHVLGVDTDGDASHDKGGPEIGNGINRFVHYTALFLAGGATAVMGVSSLVGLDKVESCKQARDEFAHGKYDDHEEREQEHEEAEDLREQRAAEAAKAEEHRVAEAVKPYFCTTSAKLADVCFCSHDEAECGLHQRSYADVGIETNACQQTPVATCPLAERAK